MSINRKSTSSVRYSLRLCSINEGTTSQATYLSQSGLIWEPTAKSPHPRSTTLGLRGSVRRKSPTLWTYRVTIASSWDPLPEKYGRLGSDDFPQRPFSYTSENTSRGGRVSTRPDLNRSRMRRANPTSVCGRKFLRIDSRFMTSPTWGPSRRGRRRRVSNSINRCDKTCDEDNNLGGARDPADECLSPIRTKTRCFGSTAEKDY